MAYSEQDIRSLFRTSFDKSKWTDFIINFFKAQELQRNPDVLDIDPEEGLGYYWGLLHTNDGYDISFFYVKMKSSIDRRRVGLRQIIDKYIKYAGDAGIAVFDDGEHWRLSFITDLKEEKTDPKRFTFVMGDADSYYNTAVSRFLELQRKGITFANIRETFSVEALTKQFYNELFDWYLWALDPSSGVYFPNNPNTPVDDREQLDTKIIRLLTRMMFVWFIKQKKLVPNDIFRIPYLQAILKDFDPMSMESGVYYNAILQNLFFATLNRPIVNVTYDKDGNKIIEHRGFAKAKNRQDVKSLYRYEELFKIPEEKIVSIYATIPFINGGLFECLDKSKTQDGVEHAYYEDGFSRNNTIVAGRYTRRAFIPNRLFFDRERGLISIFKRYNFTVEENSPMEQQIALDPELLGKVFENLLGVYNPETKETARNNSGSFYTPREVVNYMVDTSLQAYLGECDDVKALFHSDFEFDESKKPFYNDVINKLESIKVLDPACGSGAFPIGMLNRVVQILQELHAEGSKYDLKLRIMENCIYGSDIQIIAEQITKLRFFISLVCDCEKNDDPMDNYGIPNLPNLETHFVTADSLIGLNRPSSYTLFESKVIEKEQKLHQVRHEHFMAKTIYQKTKLRDQDKQLRDELAKLLSDDDIIASNIAHQMAAWNPYDQNAQSPFFDPEWMYGIKDGFDIVLGNPPYIQLQNNGGELANKYALCGYQSFAKTGDIYCLFYEMGIKMLRKNGHLCYITSNKWMRAGYGEKLRNFFEKHTNPKLLVDFAGVKVFESATVDTNILLLQKCTNEHRTICAVADKKNAKTIMNNLSLFVQQLGTDNNFKAGEAWVILTPVEQSIKQKIESVGTPLGDWDIQIYRGVLTGCNEAFIIDEAKHQEILNNCSSEDELKRTDELIRPILRGRDIKRYGYNWKHLYIINTHNGVKGKLPRIHIEDYPAVKAHLDQYWDKIERRADQGDTPYNLRNCAYVEDFSKPKVIYMEIQTDNPQMGYPFPCFSYDNNKCVVLNTAYIMCSRTVDTRIILATLNSSLGKILTKFYVTQLQQRQFRMLAQYVTNFPIAKPSESQAKQLIDLVEKQLRNYSNSTDEEINQMVFDIYGLTEEERKYVSALL